MPISHQLETIFIHVAKAGGTSIIKNKQFGFSGPDHRFAVHAKSSFSKWWDTYFKCCIVRNPWDRAVSAFEYAKMDVSYWHDNVNNKKCSHPDYPLLNNKTFSETIDVLYEDFLSNKCTLKHQGWLPQYKYICDENFKILIDKVFYLDNVSMNTEFQQRFPNTPHINKSKREYVDYKQYYTPETFDKISEIYKKDIEMFNFVF